MLESNCATRSVFQKLPHSVEVLVIQDNRFKRVSKAVPKLGIYYSEEIFCCQVKVLSCEKSGTVFNTSLVQLLTLKIVKKPQKQNQPDFLSPKHPRTSPINLVLKDGFSLIKFESVHA